MSSATSASDKLASSVHRSILGTLLTVVSLFGLAYGSRILAGQYLLGIVGLLVAVGASYWVSQLFIEGLRER